MNNSRRINNAQQVGGHPCATFRVRLMEHDSAAIQYIVILEMLTRL